MPEMSSRRNAVIGGITLTAIALSFILALRARDRVDVALVIVAPAGTMIEVDGDAPRRLPAQPNTSAALASYYFITDAGDHQVRFQEPGRPVRTQPITVPATDLPVIFTLMQDTLRAVRERGR